MVKLIRIYYHITSLCFPHKSATPGQPVTNCSDECDGDSYIVDLNGVDGKGRNALHIAIQNNCPADIIESLINRAQ